MAKVNVEYFVEQTKALLAAPSANDASKAAANAFLAAVGTDKEEEAIDVYVEALKQLPSTIDELVAFANSDLAAQIFGDGVTGFRAHAAELKASGAAFCDCPACTACLNMLKEAKVL